MAVIKSDKEWKLRHCRLYNGEEDKTFAQILRGPLPFKEPDSGYKENKSEDEIKSILAMFYAMEECWVEKDDEYHFSTNDHVISEYKHKIGDVLDADKLAPFALKCILFNGFLNWVDGLYQRFNTRFETELFIRYYKEYYQPILTPNQKRLNERLPILLKKCRYYQGEKVNPWEYCYSPVLVYRRKIWSMEKEWCEAMACSYNCPQSSKQLIKDFVLEEFFKAKGYALSLVNLIVLKEKSEEPQKKFGPAEAIKVMEKYEKLKPLGRDHRMYFAFYMGEKEYPYGNEDDAEYKHMGWSQELLQIDHTHDMCDFDSKDFQKKYRGKEGIWGWYADPHFPLLQKQILYFTICNWGMWCPYSDEDKLAEEYLNYHYPGDGWKHTDRYYHAAAVKEIQNEIYYKTVRFCGMYNEKRAYRPIFKDEYKKQPPCLGLPLVILVDKEGEAESIQEFRSFEIYESLERKK